MKSSHVALKQSKLKKIGTWCLWALIYVVVFYIGNVVGEFAVSRFPLKSMKMPSLALDSFVPKVAIRFNSNTSLFEKPSSLPEVTTKPVLIKGMLFAVPTEKGTAAEYEALRANVAPHVRQTSSVSVMKGCVMNPTFVEIPKDTPVAVTNTSTENISIGIGTKRQVIESMKRMDMSVENKTSPVLCNDVVVGFILIKE
jgi:hypothetical protein